ncbi:polysaccharide deacetylase family protein [Winogradskyella sp. 3972H.M.0a.05]|uniref:polysaccharide deacetylase family protein n=1 Tax=Winogradskyella sp. 3972H.M.0a.05 TaxID=2950277 RepID=UPI00339684ED
MDLTPAKTPKVVKSLFPSYVWDIPSKHQKTIYLTFDDGPTPEVTEWVMDTLKAYNAKATFFCIGNNVEKHPDIFKKLIDEGHAIGNHTFNHLKGWKVKTSTYLEDVEHTKTIFSSNSKTTSLFRPPYGKLKPKQGRKLQKLGYKIMMWDVLSFDWSKEVSEIQCLENVISNATSGSIVVFHDSLKAKDNLEFALPKVLEYYSKEGYSFKAIEV